MIVRDEYDPSCMNRHCDSPRTMNGHLCSECNRRRYGTLHARWNDQEYLRATVIEVDAMNRRNAEQLASRKRTEERRRAA
jgi:hypothetical protein